MQIHIFRGSERIFGCTLDASGGNLPVSLAPWTAFKTIEVTRDGEPIPGLNSVECLDDVDRYGLYLTEAHVRVTENYV